MFEHICCHQDNTYFIYSYDIPNWKHSFMIQCRASKFVRPERKILCGKAWLVFRPTISIISSEISTWTNRLVGPSRHKVAPYNHTVNPVCLRALFPFFHLRKIQTKKEKAYLGWPKCWSYNLLEKASGLVEGKYLQNPCTGMYIKSIHSRERFKAKKREWIRISKEFLFSDRHVWCIFVCYVLK